MFNILANMRQAKATKCRPSKVEMAPVGAVVTSLGHPSWSITFPMDCYAGYFYSH